MKKVFDTFNIQPPVKTFQYGMISGMGPIEEVYRFSNGSVIALKTPLYDEYSGMLECMGCDDLYHEACSKHEEEE